MGLDSTPSASKIREKFRLCTHTVRVRNKSSVDGEHTLYLADTPDSEKSLTAKQPDAGSVTILSSFASMMAPCVTCVLLMVSKTCAATHSSPSDLITVRPTS